jgi:hypothetical protein
MAHVLAVRAHLFDHPQSVALLQPFDGAGYILVSSTAINRFSVFSDVARARLKIFWDDVARFARSGN